MQTMGSTRRSNWNKGMSLVSAMYTPERTHFLADGRLSLLGHNDPILVLIRIHVSLIVLGAWKLFECFVIRHSALPIG